MLPGPGAALALADGKRLLFCGHFGGYSADVVFYTDDAGQSFQVAASTQWGRSVLAAMDECSFTQFANGTVLLILRNNGGFPGHDSRGKHNPRCADGGMCKAYSVSHDRGETWTPPRYLSQVRTGSCICESAALALQDSSLLFSGGDSDAPPQTGRRKMTLRKSTDGGVTWPQQWLLDGGEVAYSQLVTLPSRHGLVGVLWEAESPDRWFIGEMRLAWVPYA